jgi:hypothetical protein
MDSKNVKIVVFVPESHSDILREVIGNSGAGKIGNYSHCTFSSKGTGRFKPEQGAHPNIGEIGKLESVLEERIEFVCERSIVPKVISEIKKAHPYEEVAFDIYPLEEI